MIVSSMKVRMCDTNAFEDIRLLYVFVQNASTMSAMRLSLRILSCVLYKGALYVTLIRRKLSLVLSVCFFRACT